MTEKDIQIILANHLLAKQHSHIVPNTNFILPYEADLVSITKADLLIEYEIKISKSDFKADFKKYKHQRFLWPGSIHLPNRFYFVIGNFLLDPFEIPQYAGFIVVENGIVIEHKSAPLLSNYKITQDNKQSLNRSLCYHYWKEKLNGK